MRKCRLKSCRQELPPKKDSDRWQSAGFCDVNCMGEHGLQKGRERLEKEQRRKHREDKERIKTLVELCGELQRIVNRYAKERDIAKGYKCISCGVRDITDAGHFYHAGSKYRTSRLRFNLLGLNGQCAYCNRYVGGGNHKAYEQGLLERYGAGHLAELEDAKLAADRGEEEALTKDEVRSLKREFRKMVREVKK